MSFDGQPPYIDPRRRPKGCQMDGLVIHDSFDVKMPSTTDYAVVQCKHEQLYLDVLTCNVEDKAFIRPRRRELDDSPVITCFWPYFPAEVLIFCFVLREIVTLM